MGEYIHALKDLTYATFCGAVSEKFCDLYWGERLLQSLFRVVNGRTLLPKKPRGTGVWGPGSECAQGLGPGRGAAAVARGRR